MTDNNWLTTREVADQLGASTHEIMGFLATMGLVGQGSAPSSIALAHGLASEADDYASRTTLWHSNIVTMLAWTGLEPVVEESADDTALFDLDDESPIARAMARAQAKQARPVTADDTRKAKSSQPAIPGADKYGFEQVIATDGACSGNPGPGGWAWFDEMSGVHDSGGSSRTTNNIMELTAMLEALKHADDNVPLLIRADSQYVINVVTQWGPGWRRKGWKKADGKPVANQELVAELLSAYEARTADTKIDWVRGHNGDAGNEEADRLAVIQRDRHA